MINKKKVCIFTISMEKGGAETAIHNLLTKLNDDFELHLVLLRKKRQYEIPANVKVHFLKNNEVGKFESLIMLKSLARKYAAYIQEQGIDFSLSFLERPNFIACKAKTYNPNCKYFITISAALGEWYKKESLSGKLGRYLVKKYYPTADLIIPNCYSLKEHCKNEFNLPESITKVIYNGIEIASIRKQKTEYVEIETDIFTFVHLGSFYPVKNHELLLNAFAEVIKHKTARLILLGKGFLKEKIAQLIKDKNLSNQVHLVGYVENPFKYISNAHCFVLSSNLEGLPTVLLESLACGVPIISTDCKTGPREILAPHTNLLKQIESGVEKGEYGLLVPPKDIDSLKEAMLLMMSDEKLHAKYRDKAAVRAMDFDQQKIIEAYKTILNQHN